MPKLLARLAFICAVCGLPAAARAQADPYDELYPYLFDTRPTAQLIEQADLLWVERARTQTVLLASLDRNLPGLLRQMARCQNSMDLARNERLAGEFRERIVTVLRGALSGEEVEQLLQAYRSDAMRTMVGRMLDGLDLREPVASVPQDQAAEQVSALGGDPRLANAAMRAITEAPADERQDAMALVEIYPAMRRLPELARLTHDLSQERDDMPYSAHEEAARQACFQATLEAALDGPSG